MRGIESGGVYIT